MERNPLLLTIACCLQLALVGCMQAELNGPVTGTRIVIEGLIDPYLSRHVLPATTGPEDWQALLQAGEWENLTDVQQMLLIGTSPIPSDLELDPEGIFRIYTLGGEGHDYDSDMNLLLDDEPSLVEGRLYAVASGERIMKSGLHLSTLTTAAYYYLDNLPTEGTVRSFADSIAANVVADVDSSGQVDYDDILSWSRMSHQQLYLRDPSLLNQMAELIATDGSYIAMREQAEEVMGAATPSTIYIGGPLYNRHDGHALEASLENTRVPQPHIWDKATRIPDWYVDDSEALSVLSIEWWGFYASADPLAAASTQEFSVAFYANESHLPGSLIAEQRVTVSAQPVDRGSVVESTDPRFDGHSLYRYAIELDQPLYVSRGDIWFSIVKLDADGSSDDDWVWHASTGGGTWMAFLTDHGGWLTARYPTGLRANYKISGLTISPN